MQGFRKLHIVELLNFYLLFVIKSSKMGRHVACMVAIKNRYNNCYKSINGMCHLGYLGMVGTIILE